jgi:lipopolysaccharide transport system ATP-binding protein
MSSNSGEWRVASDQKETSLLNGDNLVTRHTSLATHNLSKSYRLYPSPRTRLRQMFTSRPLYTTHEALKPLSLSVARGETLGIVGQNGSGKSTLLQLIAGTLTPTSGTLEKTGRVAALLELGAGFNPEFTGRENVYLNAAILGLSHAETAAKFDEIAAFAHIGDFIDRPVSTYSSGMIVRLAFAVATAVAPDILIVDEALSVGDEAFQCKCFARIEAMRDAGTTILFVSHSAQMVLQLCDRVLWLDHGESLMLGDPKRVMDAYQHFLNTPEERRAQLRHEILQGELATSPSPFSAHEIMIEYPPDGARITHPQLLTLAEKPVLRLEQGQEYLFRYTLTFDRDAEAVQAGMMIKNQTGLEVACVALHLAEHGYNPCVAGRSLTITFRFRCLLFPRRYFLNCGAMAVRDGKEFYLHRLVDAFVFDVINPSQRNAHGVQPGGMTDLDFAATIR